MYFLTEDCNIRTKIPVRSKVHPWQSCSRLICFIRISLYYHTADGKGLYYKPRGFIHVPSGAQHKPHVQGESSTPASRLRRLRNIFFSSSSGILLRFEPIQRLKPGQCPPLTLTAQGRPPPLPQPLPAPQSPPHPSLPSQLPQDHAAAFSLRPPPTSGASVSPHARRGGDCAALRRPREPPLASGGKAEPPPCPHGPPPRALTSFIASPGSIYRDNPAPLPARPAAPGASWAL